MDGTVVAAIAIAAAYLGYVLGILLLGGSSRRGGGEGDEAPVTPSGLDDFALWERELTAVLMDAR
jgi:hypothetical protein